MGLADYCPSWCPCFGNILRRYGYDPISSRIGGDSSRLVSHHQGSTNGGTTTGGAGGANDASIIPEIQVPRWVEDEEVEKCWGCASRFDMINRKHHCRRCKNCFCQQCTSKERPVALLGFMNPVRVCSRCWSELGKEVGK